MNTSIAKVKRAGKVNQTNKIDSRKVAPKKRQDKTEKPVKTGDDKIEVLHIPLEFIVSNPLNPRKYFDKESLDELSDNIKSFGVLQPITVRKYEEKFEIIFGERRYRASKIAEQKTIPCLLVQADDDKTFEMMITENLQRQDIRPTEEAAAYKYLMGAKKYNYQDLSTRFNKSLSYIHQRLLLNKLIPEIIEMVDQDTIKLGFALEMAKYSHETQQDIIQNHILTESSYESWKELSINSFADKVEKTYTHLLTKYDFDKTECNSCPQNSELGSLFPNFDKSRCTNPDCITKKKVQHAVDFCIREQKIDPTLIICRDPWYSLSDLAQKMFADNHIEILREESTDYPEKPQEPVKEWYETEDDYLAAFEKYEMIFADYKTEMQEVEILYNTYPTMKKCINISHLRPRFAYFVVEEEQPEPEEFEEMEEPQIQPADTNEIGCEAESTSMEIVQANHETEERDDQVKIEISSIENKIDNLKSIDERLKNQCDVSIFNELRLLFNAADVNPTEISDLDESLLCFFLTESLKRNLFKFFGFTDNLYLSDENKFDIISNLSKNQKTILIRQFIIGKFYQQTYSSTKYSLLKQYAEFLFPHVIDTILNKKTEFYLKEHNSMLEKINTLDEQANDLRKQLSDYVDTDQSKEITLSDQVDTSENEDISNLDEDSDGLNDKID